MSTIEPTSGEPTWDIARMFPDQGAWSEAEYLALDASRIVEFDDGYLEIHEMPTLRHQLIVKQLFRLIDELNDQHGFGTVLFAPLPIRLWEGKYREPDIVVLRPNRITDLDSQPTGADLVIEVVSQGAKNRERDLVVKREEYARAEIAEYWIADPESQTLIVYGLETDTSDWGKYQLVGEFDIHQEVSSKEFPNLKIQVNKVFGEE